MDTLKFKPYENSGHVQDAFCLCPVNNIHPQTFNERSKFSSVSMTSISSDTNHQPPH